MRSEPNPLKDKNCRKDKNNDNRDVLPHVNEIRRVLFEFLFPVIHKLKVRKKSDKREKANNQVE